MVLSMLAVSVFKKLTEQNFKLITVQRVQYFSLFLHIAKNLVKDECTSKQ